MADTSYQPTPWLDTMLNEEHLLEGLVGICLNNGWTKVGEFTKVVYPSKLTKPTIKRFYLPLANPDVDVPEVLNDEYYIFLEGEICPITYYKAVKNGDGTTTITFEPGVSGQVAIYYSDVKGTDEFEFYVAKHYIVRNASGNLFGMAMLANFKEQMQNTGCKVPFSIYDSNIDDEYDFGAQLRPQDLGVFSWAKQKAEEEGLYERHTLYFYQLEKFANGGRWLTGWDKPADYKRLALDAEIQTTMWGLADQTNALQFKITDKYPSNYQSPIVTAHTRIPQLENVEKLGFLDVKYTNWWDDSKVFVKGFIDGKSLMFIIIADTAPVWDSNAVPAIPLYMGDFEIDGAKDEVVNRDITFDFHEAQTRASTVISSKPMINAGSTVKIWLMGDCDGDVGNESITLKIGDTEVGKFNTADAVEPTGNRDDAQFMGEFPITGVEGKNNVTIEAVSDSDVSGYSPVSARMWLELTINTDKNADGAPSALFSGTAYSKDGEDVTKALKRSAEFDYDDVNLKQEVLLPIMKDYSHYPSNGVDSIMVKRTKYGARYQAHYLSWNVPSNTMPPVRQNKDGHKHPRAWDNFMNEQYKFQFSPSRYSGKAHSSRALLIHPEDGGFGTLRNVILVSPLTIMNGDELKVVKNHCDDENKYEVYSYYLVEGISPLTKRPATAFRPAGLGILKAGYTLPEIPPPPPPPPPLVVNISPSSSTIEAGASIKFTSTYSKHSPMSNFKWDVSSDVSRGSFTVDNATFVFKNAGTYQVAFAFWNELGQKGVVSATVVVNEPPLPPPPPPPPPPPNTLQCGHLNDTGGGRITEKYHEMGDKSGSVRIDYDMYGYPDRIDVFYQSQLLASSNGYVVNKGQVNFSYAPVGGVTQIKVIISSDSDGTSWEYMVNCPV
ncbi:putative major virion structural protein [Brevibacillus phage SecTim467]|uniref:Putative major virion structural protein n=2 Tax=Jenstvirus jenst TaxID=1982225 RepID=A0A0K2CPJ7_9CAUD|nr:virion structural protein [Brevibacillus phage Jenst]ALA07171.1 putative major virion structural protein [Brevibacillus phage Jenst]ALA07540.1 putative major virion structural protein [Brevibacillus phage SecTim467]